MGNLCSILNNSDCPAESQDHKCYKSDDAIKIVCTKWIESMPKCIQVCNVVYARGGHTYT